MMYPATWRLPMKRGFKDSRKLEGEKEGERIQRRNT